MYGYTYQLVATAFFLVVGVRLLLLSRRTAEAPEKLLGLHFFLSGLAYFGWVIPGLFQLNEAESQLNFVFWFDLIPWAVYGIGMVPFLIFARVVFRPNAAWAKWMVGTCTLMLFSATTMWFIQAPGYYVIENPWYWCYWLGYTIPYAWVTVEAFLSYRAAHRRALIGLCSPIVVNRYFLFGLLGVDQMAICVTDFLEMMNPADSDFTNLNGIYAGFDFAIGTIENVGILILLLVFFPPTFYRNWINGAVPAASISGGTS